MKEAQTTKEELIDDLSFLSREELIEELTQYILMNEKLQAGLELLGKSLEEMEARNKKVAEIDELSDWLSTKKGELTSKMIEYAQKKFSATSDRARNAATALHEQPGGSREKRNAILEIWASGKYSSRDLCAEQECAALGMSYSTARKALRGTPSPT